MNMMMSKNGEVTVAGVVGRLDTTTSADAEKSIQEAIDGGAVKIVIDFSQTSYISSAGLRIILKTAKSLHQKSGKLALCGANEQIYEVLEMSGFLTMMAHHDSLEDAVAAVA